MELIELTWVEDYYGDNCTWSESEHGRFFINPKHISSVKPLFRQNYCLTDKSYKTAFERCLVCLFGREYHTVKQTANDVLALLDKAQQESGQ